MTVRPFPKSGLKDIKEWFVNETWEEVSAEVSSHKKAEIFQSILLEKLDEIFPTKTRKINSDDQPWVTHKLKNLDRKRKRTYHKERRSENWIKLNNLFKKEVKSAKSDFYQKMIADLKKKKPAQWYSSLKRITSYDVHKKESVIVDEISHLQDKEQAEKIADIFEKVYQEYDPLKKEDIGKETMISR